MSSAVYCWHQLSDMLARAKRELRLESWNHRSTPLPQHRPYSSTVCWQVRHCVTTLHCTASYMLDTCWQHQRLVCPQSGLRVDSSRLSGALCLPQSNKV